MANDPSHCHDLYPEAGPTCVPPSRRFVQELSAPRRGWLEAFFRSSRKRQSGHVLPRFSMRVLAGVAAVAMAGNFAQSSTCRAGEPLRSRRFSTRGQRNRTRFASGRSRWFRALLRNVRRERVCADSTGQQRLIQSRRTSRRENWMTRVMLALVRASWMSADRSNLAPDGCRASAPACRGRHRHSGPRRNRPYPVAAHR